MIAQYGLKSKGKKSKSFAPGAPKSVTGTVIVGGELRLPNERHQKIHDTRVAYMGAGTAERVTLRRQLRGREQEAAQVFRAGAKPAADSEGS